MQQLRRRLRIPDWIFTILLLVFTILFAFILLLSVISIGISITIVQLPLPSSFRSVFAAIIVLIIFINIYLISVYWSAHKLISPRGNKLFLFNNILFCN
ncbi:hypothetical protein Vdis_0109 [Vulcanisaeta distributa DSM 14429]|uniref:Uncharacterized protein n=1 Tax=Vulcanisaeta distributa (strain DSM 14429 / JCM 11212 / NBRC 100878 / IC-017) TaxID=572478 RepID=E1QSC9_VULDI|nr:hypothetical protein Vdis_0109 [Vulcanisaeta distributa DSM 14429]